MDRDADLGPVGVVWSEPPAAYHWTRTQIDEYGWSYTLVPSPVGCWVARRDVSGFLHIWQIRKDHCDTPCVA